MIHRIRALGADALPPRPIARGKLAVLLLGFNLHAAVRIDACDWAGRERLLRYCTRAPLSLERLSMTRDGHVAYKLQRPWRRGETHRVMEPVELLARLSALIPPPRHPLVRFHGVLAPHSSWRQSVVPAIAPPAPDPAMCSTVGSAGTDIVGARRVISTGVAADNPTQALPARGALEAVLDPELLRRPPNPVRFQPSKASNSSAVWRVDWATLLKRVHNLDALACPCGGRLKFVEVVTEADRCCQLLTELGFDPIPPPIPRCRSPSANPIRPRSADW